jgi:integrase
MAKVAKPYEEGSGWSLRRRVFGQDLFVSGHASGAAAKKAMDKLVQGLESRGKPKGLGPRKTTVAQALQDMGMERLPFMKGAKQEANRFNRYLRAAGLATLKVTPRAPAGGEQAGLTGVDRNGKGPLYDVKLEPPKPKRAIPRGLAAHRAELAGQTAQAEVLRERLAGMTFAKVQTHHVQDFLHAIQAASRKPATLQLERAPLRRLFNYARKVWCWSEPSENPAVGVVLPTVRNNRERVMSVDEERRLDEAVQSCRNDLVGPTLTLLTESAMRSSEPLEYARWVDVDWDANILRLRDSKTDSREVPLSPKAIEALRELAQLNPSGPEDHIVRMSYEALKAAWIRACKRAGITDLNIHDLRHTAATRMALKTGNVFIVKALAGHKNLSQLERYVNVSARDVVKVMHAPVQAPTGAQVDALLAVAHAPALPVMPEPARSDEQDVVDVVGNLVRVDFGNRRAA